MALTTDFTGTYDYEAEEARSEFEGLIAGRDSGDYTDAELQDRVSRIAKHWSKVFDESSFRDFVIAWNECCNAAGLPLGFYIIE